MSVRSAIQTVFEADGTLTGLLTGGIHTVRQIKRTQNGTPPFDVRGELEPCCNIKEETEIPIRAHDNTHRMFVAVYLYERDGFTNIAAAADRIYALLHRQQIGSSGDRIFEVFHSNTLADLEDETLDASMIVSRYEVIRNRE